MTDPFPGALRGIRVLDLSRVLAGPSCTQLLADLGADVIKIERPGTGDDTRQWGPPWLRDEAGSETAESSYYLSINRGKRSVTVNIGTPEGADLVRELARHSDIVVENFKVGSLAKKGLDYRSLRSLREDIIYASITGLGQDGPLAEKPGYDYLAQAMSGLMSVTGRPDDEPGGGPMRTGVAIADQATGMYATVGILAALHHRQRTGEGQHLDVSLLDSNLAFLINQGLSYLISGESPSRTGEWHPSLAPYQPFDVSDGRIVVAVGNNGQFAALCNWLGLPTLITDPRFVENPDRNRYRLELAGLLQEAFRSRSRQEVLDGLAGVGVPAAFINDIAGAFAEPQVIHRGGRIDLPHSTAGTAPGIANPLHLSQTPVVYRQAPPILGEHTHEVLAEVLEMSSDEIANLAAQHII